MAVDLYCGRPRFINRKRGAAEVAKIPFPLAQHIARVYAS